MTGTDWVVIVAGVSAIAWVNWYFFLAERRATAVAAAGPAGERTPAAADTTQAATIVVRGGYAPSTLRVRAGEPVRLTFDRQETASCSEEIVFPDFHLRTFLPAHERTTIVVTPPRPGTYEFTCGMSMLHGRLIAE